MDNQMTASKPAIHGKITWPDESSMPQNFSLPFSIIYYISKNPSTPTVYLKLAQSCKYFFEKLPLLVANNIFDENGETKFCDNEHSSEDECSVCVNIDITKISSKIWLTNSIYVYGIYHPNFVSLLSSKLYRSDIIQFELYDQEFLLNDFKFMALSAKDILLIDVKVIYRDGNLVTLNAIFEAVPNIEEFVFLCNPTMFDSSTLKNITKLQNLSNLRELCLYGIPEIANAIDVLSVIKKLKHAKFEFDFDHISNGFMNQLNDIVDAVIEDETLKCVFSYDGHHHDKWKIMYKRYCD